MSPLFDWRHRHLLAGLPEALGTLAVYAELEGQREVAASFRGTAAHVTGLDAAERGVWLRRVLDADDSRTEARAVRRLASEGVPAVLAAERARLPRDLARLLAVPDVTLADVLALHRRFGAVTASDLSAVVALSGLRSSDVEESGLLDRLRAALPALRLGHPRLPLGLAWSVASEMTDGLHAVLGADTPIEPVGSLRRYEPTVGDIELLVTADDPDDAIDRAAGALADTPVTYRGRQVIVAAARGEQVTVRSASPAEAPFARLIRTGAGPHVRQLQQRALDRGWQLGPCGMYRFGASEAWSARDEAEVYARLDLAFVPPELRHGDDELEAAAAGAVPTLVTVDDIRGDLHVHTLWSDGRDSVETMVVAARQLGYEYVAITDHSPSAAASRTLTLDRLAQQRDEVARARERVSGLTVLHGVEVDILPDGRLDFPDDVLAGLDIVLASLHDAAGHGPDRLLSRYAAAMRHPLVNVVTHPANRLVGRHEGYDLDFDALFELAVETGTILEVDGAPGHLDLDGHLARRAVAAGVTLSIDSDCHNAVRLGRQMRLGVGTARRGWVEARHVVNTRPLAEVQALFRRKRRDFTPSDRAD